MGTEKGLTGNQLKLIAMLCMTVDHAGMMLFPQCVFLRVIGRLAFPIYAYMIAEGCRHTRSMGKYLLSLFAVAVLCQSVYFITTGSLYMYIMVTFSLSVGLIWLLCLGERTQSVVPRIAAVTGMLLVFILTQILPLLLSGTDYGIDYGFLGVMIPVAVYLLPRKWQRLFGNGSRALYYEQGLLCSGLVTAGTAASCAL